MALVQTARGYPLEVYDALLPLVVEVWSAATGDFDVASKVPEYQARGDEEIWRIQPFERTLTSWVRQGDGSYRLVLHPHGSVRATFLPWVVDLAVLFDG